MASRAAEKAIKALFQYLHGEARGHSITGLLKALPNQVAVPSNLQDAGIRLERLYIPTRYAHAFSSGAPADYFGENDAREAIGGAKAIVDLCERRISGPREDD